MNAFVNQWLGKRVDYDGAYNAQCVDLIKQYLAQVHGFQPGAWGNAKDYWLNPNPALLSKFYKVQTSDAVSGDILIFRPTTNNPYGHISIAINSNSMLEQNGGAGNGTGTGTDAIRVRSIPKQSLYGVLRLKGASPPPSQGVDNMPVKLSLGPARILGAGVLGRDYNATHQGQFDADFNAHHVGSPLTNEYLQGLFNSAEAQAAARDRQAKQDFYLTWKDKLAELQARPTQDKVQELVDAMAQKEKVIDACQADLRSSQQKIIDFANDPAVKVGNWFKRFLLKLKARKK